VTQFEIIEGPEKGKKVFKGKIILVARVSPDPRIPPQRVPFEFDFPEGKTFNWVKNNFDDVAEKAKVEWEKEQKRAREEAELNARKQVVTSGGMPGGGLIGPSGRPIRG
jgi:hypothetical protein